MRKWPETFILVSNLQGIYLNIRLFNQNSNLLYTFYFPNFAGCLDERTLDKQEYLPLLETFKEVGLRLPIFAPLRRRIWNRSASQYATDSTDITK